MSTTNEPTIVNGERFRYETARAIDAYGFTMPEMLEPASLYMTSPDEDGWITITSLERTVGRIGAWRLRPIDHDLIAPNLNTVAESIEDHHLAEAFREAVALGRWVLAEPHRSDWITVLVMVSEAARPLPVHVFRPALVTGWPRDDWPEPIPAPEVAPPGRGDPS